MSTLLFIALVSCANLYNEAFDEGTAAYHRGDYPAAIEKYEQLIGESVAAAAVFYNLGNAYYRGGHIGPAIANYERALQLNPSFDNARENRDKAVRETKRQLARPLPAEWEQSLLFWHYGLGRMTTDFLAALFWIAFWAVLAIRQWRPIPYTRRAALVLGLLALAFGASAWAKAHPAQLAVANDDPVPVRYATDETSTVRFELYAGDRVTVDKRMNGWARVTTIDGERGWARDSSLTFVGPPYERPSLSVTPAAANTALEIDDNKIENTSKPAANAALAK